METKQLNREKIWGEFRTLLRETATKLSITVSEDTLSVFEVTRSAPTERKVLLNFKAPYDHCFVHIEEGQSKTVRQFSFQQDGHIKWQGEITEMSQEDAAKKIMKFLAN